MRLNEYFKTCENDKEYTIFDTDELELELYFYNESNKDDNWSKAIETITAALEVKDISPNGCITVNLTELVEKLIKHCKEDLSKMFYYVDTESIMAEIESIFAGCVSEEYLNEFAQLVQKVDNLDK